MWRYCMQAGSRKKRRAGGTFKYSAMTPLTKGVAMEVPDSASYSFVAGFGPPLAEFIPDPAATTSLYTCVWSRDHRLGIVGDLQYVVEWVPLLVHGAGKQCQIGDCRLPRGITGRH